MLQRLALLEALQAGCPLLLLDEPFSGLDDAGRAWLAGQLAERVDAGAAVLMTDHSGAAAGRVALAVMGTYAYRDNERGASFAVTSLMACALAAWTTGAVLAAEPAPQNEMATAALGGRRARTGLEALLIAAVATALTAVFVAYPLALVALGVDNEFDPHVRAGDVAAGVLGQLCCAALGGAIGVLFAPPRVARRATAAAAVIAALLLLVAVSSMLGPAGGPVAFAQAEADAASGAVTGAVFLGCLSCLALAAAVLAAASRCAARAG